MTAPPKHQRRATPTRTKRAHHCAATTGPARVQRHAVTAHAKCAPQPGLLTTPTPLVDAVDTELSEPIRVVSARLWALAVAFLLAFCVTTAWAIGGSWPQHLSATAIVQHGSGPQLAVATQDGSVTELRVRVGEPVRRGQSLARVQTATGNVAVLSPVDGTAVALLANPGDAVRPGTPIVSIDPTHTLPTAELVLTSVTDLQRLSAGQRVALDVAGSVLTGTIAATAPVTTSAGVVARGLTANTSGLPSDATPVWLVPVELDPGQNIAVASTAHALVRLPSIPVYKLVIGDHS